MNTGVGRHFLLQCMKVKSESEVAQSCLTLSNPMDCSLPGSSTHGIFQARALEWGASAFSFISSTTADKVTETTEMYPLSAGGCKLGIQVPAGLFSSEASLLGLQVATFLL